MEHHRTISGSECCTVSPLCNMWICECFELHILCINGLLVGLKSITNFCTYCNFYSISTIIYRASKSQFDWNIHIINGELNALH